MLTDEVAKKYKIKKGWNAPAVQVGNFPRITFANLNLATADWLYSNKFPFLELAENPPDQSKPKKEGEKDKI